MVAAFSKVCSPTKPPISCHTKVYVESCLKSLQIYQSTKTVCQLPTKSFSQVHKFSNFYQLPTESFHKSIVHKTSDFAPQNSAPLLWLTGTPHKNILLFSLNIFMTYHLVLNFTKPFHWENLHCLSSYIRGKFDWIFTKSLGNIHVSQFSEHPLTSCFYVQVSLSLSCNMLKCYLQGLIAIRYGLSHIIMVHCLCLHLVSSVLYKCHCNLGITILYFHQHLPSHPVWF